MYDGDELYRSFTLEDPLAALKRQMSIKAYCRRRGYDAGGSAHLS